MANHNEKSLTKLLADAIGEEPGVVEATLNTLHEAVRLVETMTGYGPFKDKTYGEVADAIFGSFEPRIIYGRKYYPLNGEKVYPVIAAFRAAIWYEDELTHPSIREIYDMVNKA